MFFSRTIILILAAACGLIVANLYYAQPLIGPISEDLGLSSGAAGLIVTLAQVGYGLGLLFLVPLGDIVENRKLVVILLVLAGIVLALGGVLHNVTLFLFASMMIGTSSVAAQILVPFAAHLSPEASRGRNVGSVMSGLLLGIMLARPVSSLVAEYLGWRIVYYLSSAAMLVLALVLLRTLPVRQPSTSTGYSSLIRSMLKLLKSTPILQRRALYHACVFGTFSLFWTTVPLYLTGPAFRFSQQEVALFALVGVSGALAAPIAGRLADRGWIRPATGIALGLVLISMALPLANPSGSTFALVLLFIAAIVLDMGVTTNLVLSQRVIFSLGSEVRSRLNGLFMAIFFAGGAIGSALGGWAYAAAGWNTTLWIAIAMPALALIYYGTERPS
ncbi:putative MFS family arabinose efflux permease [Paenibacillus taihuensis]|uniref:Putative MFS family arabinose efflux permease n=1 Tax=Paenibacillus taihuensis TaxID=1156355 RepID=A0A3D9RHQ9_9BACL|nr:MFS transporter [Paenibacillus taihuensis]REE78642.1 putative MFS family arabinose efflux permease [Paenibacillus taihuensis]